MNRHSIALAFILAIIGTGMFALIKVQHDQASTPMGTGTGTGGLIINAPSPGSSAQPAAATASPAAGIELPATGAAACP